MFFCLSKEKKKLYNFNNQHNDIGSKGHPVRNNSQAANSFLLNFEFIFLVLNFLSLGDNSNALHSRTKMHTSRQLGVNAGIKPRTFHFCKTMTNNNNNN